VIELLLFLMVADPLEVITREPMAANSWRETFVATCAADTLEIRRPIRPLSERPTVLINGQKPAGNLDLLERELGAIGAAYRFSFLCSQGKEGIRLHWVRGLASRSGQVDFRAGLATFRDGAVTQVSSEAANQESFWYR
jgi:hypothetical protein